MSGVLARGCAAIAILLGLAACTSVDSSMGMEPGNAAATATTTTAETPSGDTGLPEDTETPSETTAPAPAAPTPPAEAAEIRIQPDDGKTAEAGEVIARIAFAPVVGAPVDKVTALSARLGPAARGNNIAIVAADAPELTHKIKGYLSAFSDSGKTFVVHVWDVIGDDGERVHRVQGQQSVEGASSDPWESVPDAAMEAIADEFMADYAAWQNGRG